MRLTRAQKQFLVKVWTLRDAAPLLVVQPRQMRTAQALERRGLLELDTEPDPRGRTWGCLTRAGLEHAEWLSLPVLKQPDAVQSQPGPRPETRVLETLP